MGELLYRWVRSGKAVCQGHGVIKRVFKLTRTVQSAEGRNSSSCSEVVWACLRMTGWGTPQDPGLSHEEGLSMWFCLSHPPALFWTGKAGEIASCFFVVHQWPRTQIKDGLFDGYCHKLWRLFPFRLLRVYLIFWVVLIFPAKAWSSRSQGRHL